MKGDQMYTVKADKQKMKPAENVKDLRRLLTLLLRAGVKQIQIIKS